MGDGWSGYAILCYAMSRNHDAEMGELPETVKNLMSKQLLNNLSVSVAPETGTRDIAPSRFPVVAKDEIAILA